MKICVSGIGCISGIGLNVKDHYSSFRNEHDGLGDITLFTTQHRIPVSEIKLSNTELKELAGIYSPKTLSRTALLGIIAAQEALESSKIKLEDHLRIGLISSTTNGGMDLTELFYPAFRSNPSFTQLPYIASHEAADSTERIATTLGIKGFRTTISTACSSAANAIMLGARMIRQGMLDIVIAGGTDALCRFTLNGFHALKILDKDPCRPFDATRSGLNLGEGAGYVVLQSEESLYKEPYCELAGYANSNDAFHQTASSEEGLGAYLAMKKALEKAAVVPECIDYINAHGTGTVNNDASESMAIKRLFGNKIPPFSSTKPFTGHTLGAAGGLEAVFSVMAIECGILLPTKNFSTPMSETGLSPIVTYSEQNPVSTVLSNSFGFGGNNTSLVFRLKS